MKKIIFLFAFASLYLMSASAQITSHRQGDKATTRISTNDAAGADTIKFSPTEWMTLVIPSSTITDTVCYKIKDLSRCHTGDEMIMSFTNSSGSGHKVKLTGTWYEVSGSDSVLSLTSAKRAIIRFVFDGVKWVETGKIVQ